MTTPEGPPPPTGPDPRPEPVPAEPVAPEPVEPVPAEPVAPEPVAPEPVEPVPSEPAEPAEPEPVEAPPVETVYPAEPVAVAEPVEPAPAAEPVGPVEPVVADPAEPVEPVDAAVPVEPVEPVEPDEPADAPAAAPAGRRRWLSLLPVVALAVVTALLLATGWFAFQVLRDRQSETSRSEGLNAARDAARLLFSYDHATLKEDFEAGLAVTTGDFRDEYERTTREVVQPVAEQYDAAVEASVVEAGVVRAEPDRLVALVFLNQTTTSTRVEGPKIDQSRVRMSLKKVDGTWLVDAVSAL